MNNKYLALIAVLLVIIITILLFSYKSQPLIDPSKEKTPEAFAVAGNCNFGPDFPCEDFKIDQTLNGVGAFFSLRNKLSEEIRVTGINCDFGVGNSEKTTSIDIQTNELAQFSCQYDGEFPYDDIEEVKVELVYELNGRTYTQKGSIN